MEGKRKTGCIIPHTHWDREWRYPIWKNRMLLIEFMEELLGILDTQPDYRCFLMDGQVSPIEDYLEVAPEMREKVAGYIREGRIAVGPWYTLPDLYPLDGECLVRNLLKGTRVCRKYGEPLKVGYNSFGWGQTAQFPQIYKGFGIDFIICAKKVSEERAPQSEFWWEGPDGTKTLTSRLGQHARANFYFNAYLYAKYGINCLSSEYKYSPGLSGTAMHPADAARAEEDFFLIGSKMKYDPARLAKGIEDAWKAADDTAFPDDRLFLDGTDFSTPHPELTDMIRDLNAQNGDVLFVSCTLEDYAERLLGLAGGTKLKTVKGELRDGPACDCSGNALASRIYLKQLNKRVQNIVLKSAEPFAAAAAMLGAAYPKGYFDVMWKYILESHPHDSINGVTQDKTADDVEHRLKQALEMGSVACDKAVSELLKRIDLSAYSEGDTLLVVFNPHPYASRDVISVCACTPQEENVWSVSAEDGEGNPLAIQETARDEKAFPVHDLEARPWPFQADRHQFYLDTGEVPALGYKVVRVVPQKKFTRNHFYWLDMRKATGDFISRADNMLENEFLKVNINPNGTLDVTDKGTGRAYRGLNYFEDTGDVGNYWAYYPPYHNRTYTTLASAASVCCEDNGPLSATICVSYSLELPAYAHEPMYGVRGESKRSDGMAALRITSRVTLKRGSKRADIRTTVENNVKNHRLRAAFPTGILCGQACASGHFTVDSRPTAPQKDGEGQYWPEMQTLPMQHFVDMSDGEAGLAVLNNCLTEYEARDDGRGTLYLTLFRAVGNMIVTWWEAVGTFPDQMGSQVQRTMEFEYSVYPHEGGWAEGHAYREAEGLNAPMAAYQVTPHTLGYLPQQFGFVSVEPENLILSAFKKAEDRDSFILRLFNPTGSALRGHVIFSVPAKEVFLVNLNEDRERMISRDDPNCVALEVQPNKIVTLEMVLF